MTKRFFLGLAVTSLFAAGQAAQADLVGHWKFDEPAFATTAVDNTGGTNGTVGTNVATGVSGKIGNAYEFNGVNVNSTDSIVSFGNATSVFAPVVTSGQVTISAWFNWTVDNTTRGTAISFANTGTETNFIQVGVTGSNSGHNTKGGVYGGINILGNPVNSTREVVNTTGFNNGGSLVDDTLIPEGTGTALDDGQWHHVVATFDTIGDKVELFLNGVSVGTNPPIGAINPFPTFNNFELGRLGRLTKAGLYNGKIDDVQIYDRILTPTNISSLFSNPGSVIGPKVPGDADGNGFVEIADYLLIRGNSFTSVPTGTLGDVNDDSFVDFTDFQIWKQHFPGGAGAADAAIAGLNVPEPASILLCGISAVFLFVTARRKLNR